MEVPADVRIINAAGQTIAAFTLQPGGIEETSINIQGVYIVQSADGRFIKKLAVR